MQPCAIKGGALEADTEIGVRSGRIWGETSCGKREHLIKEEFGVDDEGMSVEMSLCW